MIVLSCLLALAHLALTIQSQQLDKWSGWRDWSACSRSCGGGISHQIRYCLNSTGGVGSSCFGENRRNRMCNIQDCPEGSKDFRSVQCAAYNSKKYKDKYFKWVPWPQAAFPCELSCMPKGQRFYVRLSDKVEDGTKCQEGSLDTCIDGKCEHVGCDLILNSKAKFDKCRECNGKDDRCKPVIGRFVLEDFDPDYVEMIIVPARSTTIFIKEEGPTRNYIAVKDYKGDYIFNGDWTINNPGKYKLNGHYAIYKRSSESQSVQINGPIDAPITIEVLASSKPVNFSYQYYVPNGESNGIPKTTYRWGIKSRGACSASCAGGIRKRRVECISSNSEKTVSDFLCDDSKRPTDVETCNTQPCKARWFTGEWSSCSKSCGMGERVRRVHCIRDVKNAEIEMLPFSDCKGATPGKVESCVVKEVCPIWNADQWSECSKSCGPGFKTRQVRCVGRSDFDLETLEERMCDETIKPVIRAACDLGSCNLTWTIGQWSQCSAHCGTGMRNRQITCQNSKKRVFPDGYCDKTFKPQSTEECDVAGPCLPMWYATHWSTCSRKCGYGIQMRMVYCAAKEGSNLRIIGNSNCKESLRPVKMKNCHQLKPCIAQFFASAWKPCSASCGGGLRFRRVRCYADTRIDYSEKACIHLKKPATVEICNRQSCGASVVPTTPADLKTEKTTRMASTESTRTTSTRLPTTKETTAGVTTRLTTKPTQPATTERVTIPTTARSIPAMVINFQGPASVDEGDPADFYCNAMGQPTPELVWTLNGKDINQLGSRFLLLNRNTHLLVTRASASDTGSLVCTARNAGGNESKAIQLKVSSAPKVSLSPPSANLKEGDSFFMTCQVTAYPEASITWRKGGRRYYGDTTTGRVQVTKTMIRFKKLVAADSGSYVCYAENSAGFDKRAMVLKVKSDEKEEPCIDDNERANCAIIKQFNLCGHDFYGPICCKTCSGN